MGAENSVRSGDLHVLVNEAADRSRRHGRIAAPERGGVRPVGGVWEAEGVVRERVRRARGERVRGREREAVHVGRREGDGTGVRGMLLLLLRMCMRVHLIVGVVRAREWMGVRVPRRGWRLGLSLRCGLRPRLMQLERRARMYARFL